MTTDTAARKTPLTDARFVMIDCEASWPAVHADFARSLEAQLEAARACIRDAYGIICGNTETTAGWEDRHAAAIQSAAGEGK